MTTKRQQVYISIYEPTNPRRLRTHTNQYRKRSTPKRLCEQDWSTTLYRARNWRALADETFTFARYAKEDFDSDDLDKKRSVVMKLGENLIILDRTIQFTPNKYFIPIEKMNNELNNAQNMVRTENNAEKIPLKSKNTPVGSYAVPNESASYLDVNTSWLCLQVLNIKQAI